MGTLALLFISLMARADLSAHFETNAEHQKFAKLVATLDLECPGCSLSYKDSGTSVGMKLKIGGKKAGKWVPRCSATNPEAQVVSYHMARFLGMSEFVVPSAYLRVKGGALNQFKTMLNAARERNTWRLKNRNDNLAAIAASGADGLLGVYTPQMPGGSLEAKGIANPAANTINRAHAIARFIRADGPVPSPGRRISLDGVIKPQERPPTESELELSRQFSKIMVLDMLLGQWDRWSGGNVEAGIDGSRVYFVARDNGGASVNGTAHMAKYQGIVTRFDREQIGRVRQLAELLANPATAAEMSSRLGVRSSRHSLLERAKQILEHVKAQERAHGSRAYF